MAFEITAIGRNPELADQVGRLAEQGWPAFLLHGGIAHWERHIEDFADYQILFCSPAGNPIVVGIPCFLCEPAPLTIYPPR